MGSRLGTGRRAWAGAGAAAVARCHSRTQRPMGIAMAVWRQARRGLLGIALPEGSVGVGQGDGSDQQHREVPGGSQGEDWGASRVQSTGADGIQVDVVVVVTVVPRGGVVSQGRGR